MTVTDVHKDPEILSMTITCEFETTPERLWQVWADPRLLERWWGPPTYPATFVEHALTPGGMVRYYMTGAEGDRHHGWWRVTAVEAPQRLEIEDGFSDTEGRPAEGMPVTCMVMTIESTAGAATRMQLVTTFPSLEAMEQLVSMGMEEGITAALGQVDEIVAVAA